VNRKHGDVRGNIPIVLKCSLSDVLITVERLGNVLLGRLKSGLLLTDSRHGLGGTETRLYVIEEWCERG
jgi:hypothetical protein